MARITFELPEETKRKVKAKLGANGLTFKDVLAEFCENYASDDMPLEITEAKLVRFITLCETYPNEPAMTLAEMVWSN